MSYHHARQQQFRQYDGDRSITKRHLLYHVYPSRKNDIWKRNIDRLMEHIDIFNGRRLIAVATGTGSLSFDEVANYLTGLRAQTFECPNDAELREVATFPSLIKQVADITSMQEAVFYAHTKGNTTGESVEGATIWRNIGYAYLLGGWQRCMRLLEDYSAVGIHKLHWGNMRSPYPTRLAHGNWMFAGTFFWFLPAITHAFDDWRHVAWDRYGAEAWLSGLLDHTSVTSVYQIWPDANFLGANPYDPELYSPEDRLRFGESSSCGS